MKHPFISRHRHGFTLVEAAIVAVVLVALVASLIPFLRGREQQRLQGLADTAPWEVFEFRAEPAKQSFAEGEGIVVRCEIENVSNYPLMLPRTKNGFILTLGDTGYFAGAMGNEIVVTARTTIPPRASVRFDVLIHPVGVGDVEARIVDWNGKAELYIPYPTTIRFPGRVMVYNTLSGALSKEEKRFQSSAFKLVVEAGPETPLPKFEDLIAHLDRIRRDQEATSH